MYSVASSIAQTGKRRSACLEGDAGFETGQVPPGRSAARSRSSRWRWELAMDVEAIRVD